MSKISTYLSMSLIIISFVAGTGFGYSFTPQYSLSMYDKNTMDLGRADKYVDLRYMNAMIAHHRGAMLVAGEASKSERTEIKDLAKAILTGEPPLIEELYSWKKDWYGDTKKVKDPVIPNFGNYDNTFDLRILNTIIAHHANGIEMTKDIRVKSNRSEMLNNADAVEKFLTDSGKMLENLRKTWYNI